MRILLHVCCAPCSTHAIDILRKLHDLTLFYSNSNISPEEEYHKRLTEARRIAQYHGLPLIEDAYDHAAWRAFIKGQEGEPEKGARCTKCFEFNLARAAEAAKGFDAFTTTLTISPHKDSKTIFSIGKRLAAAHAIPFLEMDFKKQNGFAHSIELSQKHCLYRQEYCGCEFSLAAMKARHAAKS